MAPSKPDFGLMGLVGTWLSLVEHSLGVRGVGSSNLPVPTNLEIPNSIGLDTTLQLLVPEAISRCNHSMRRERWVVLLAS